MSNRPESMETLLLSLELLQRIHKDRMVIAADTHPVCCVFLHLF